VKKHIPSVQVCVDEEIGVIWGVVFAGGDMGLEGFLKEIENKEDMEKLK